jgi:hypothetical protein
MYKKIKIGDKYNLIDDNGELYNTNYDYNDITLYCCSLVKNVITNEKRILFNLIYPEPDNIEIENLKLSFTHAIDDIILDKDIFYALDKEFTIVEKLLTLDGENEIFTNSDFFNYFNNKLRLQKLNNF